MTTTLTRRSNGDRAARAATRPPALDLVGHEGGLPVHPHGSMEGAAVVVTVDVVDQWGMHSFPASDPPANW